MMRVIGRRAGAALAACVMIGAQAWAQEGAGDVVYVPTPQKVVDTMLEMAKVGPNDYLIDLGSGDGRIVITAASRFGTRAMGVDLDPVLLKMAVNNAKRAGVTDKAKFVEQNLFETDLTGASVVTTYLLPEMNEKLRPKILALKPGTRVVTHDYDMGEWRPDAEKKIEVPEKTVGEEGWSYIHLFIVPAVAAGKWEVRFADRGISTMQVDLDQTFQILEGKAQMGKADLRLEGGRVRGEDVGFRVTAGSGASAVKYEFIGRLKEHTLSGMVKVQSGKSVREVPFTATRNAPGRLRMGSAGVPYAG